MYYILKFSKVGCRKPLVASPGGCSHAHSAQMYEMERGGGLIHYDILKGEVPVWVHIQCHVARKTMDGLSATIHNSCMTA